MLRDSTGVLSDTLTPIRACGKLSSNGRNFNRNSKLWVTGGRKAKGTLRVSPATEREDQMKKTKKQGRKIHGPLNHNQGPLNHNQGPFNHSQGPLNHNQACL